MSNKIQHRGCIVEIERDEYAETPDSWGDDSLFLVAGHRDFWVPGPDKEEPERAKERYKTHYVFGLEAYIHGGVVLALAGEGNFPDRQWDVSRLGYVFVSKADYGDKDRAREIALSLIREWNMYLSGDVWNVSITGPTGDDIETFGGVYGDYDETVAEAKRTIDRVTGQGTREPNGQYLFPFAAS